MQLYKSCKKKIIFVERVGLEPTRYCYFAIVPKTIEATITPPPEIPDAFLHIFPTGLKNIQPIF